MLSKVLILTIFKLSTADGWLVDNQSQRSPGWAGGDKALQLLHFTHKMTSTAPRGYLFSIFLASLFILHIPNVTCLPYYVVPAHVPNASVVAATVRQVELSFGGQATVRSTVDSGSGITVSWILRGLV